MPHFLEECRLLYKSDNLYTILNLTKDSSTTEIKRAYHRLSLKVHPDRVDSKEKEIATKKFQTLGKIYSILSNKEKKAVYDETGNIDEEDDLQQDKDWYEYWRILFSAISVNDLKQFEEKYKDSEEELNDLKSAYMDYEGDMDAILDNVLCTTIDDELRFRKMLDPLIKNKELPSFKNYTHEKKSKKNERKRKANQEAAEAESMKAELGLGDQDDSLTQLIKQRQQSRGQEMDSFFDQLAAKYGSCSATNGKKKGKKGK